MPGITPFQKILSPDELAHYFELAQKLYEELSDNQQKAVIDFSIDTEKKSLKADEFSDTKNAQTFYSIINGEYAEEAGLEQKALTHLFLVVVLFKNVDNERAQKELKKLITSPDKQFFGLHGCYLISSHTIDTIMKILSYTDTSSINLRSCTLGDETAEIIADALKDNITLTNISLYKNNITDKGAKTLIDTLKTNTTITSISLEKNNVSDEISNQIGEFARCNRILKFIDKTTTDNIQEFLIEIETSKNTSTSITNFLVRIDKEKNELDELINQFSDVPERLEILKEIKDRLVYRAACCLQEQEQYEIAAQLFLALDPESRYYQDAHFIAFHLVYLGNFDPSQPNDPIPLGEALVCLVNDEGQFLIFKDKEKQKVIDRFLLTTIGFSQQGLEEQLKTLTPENRLIALQYVFLQFATKDEPATPTPSSLQQHSLLVQERKKGLNQEIASLNKIENLDDLDNQPFSEKVQKLWRKLNETSTLLDENQKITLESINKLKEKIVFQKASRPNIS